MATQLFGGIKSNNPDFTYDDVTREWAFRAIPTVKGGVASGGDVRLQSTSHATKGKVHLGSGNNTYYDETTDTFYHDGLSLYGTKTYNVIEYGAVGDDSNNDTTAIQAAIDAAEAAGGGSVFFPRGVYKINAVLTVEEDDVVLAGTGHRSEIKNYGAAEAIKVDACSRFVMSNMAARGDGGSYGIGASGTDGILFSNAHHWRLDRVKIHRNGRHGIRLRSSSFVCSVANSRVEYNGGDGINSVSESGLSSGANGIGLTVVDNIFFQNVGDGIRWIANSLRVFNNIIEGNQGAGVHLDAVTEDVRGALAVSIVGNHIEANEGAAISLDGGQWGHRAIEIHGNLITSIFAGGGGPTALIVGSGAGDLQQIVIDASNSYTISGGQLTHYVDLGGQADARSRIDRLGPSYRSYFTNLGSAHVTDVWNGSTIEESEATAYAATSGSYSKPQGGIVTHLSNISSTTGGGAYHHCSVKAGNGDVAQGYFGFVSAATGVTPAFVIGLRTGATSYAERFRLEDDRTTISTILNLGEASELTIASGVITATSSYHKVDTQSDDATDDLVTITAATEGDLLIIRPENPDRTVVVKHGTGNIYLNGAADFSMDHSFDTLSLIFRDFYWLEIGRSSNA